LQTLNESANPLIPFFDWNAQWDAMSNNQADRVNFGIWTTAIFVGHAIGMAIFIGVAGVILSIPPRRLWVPYTTLLYCGLVLSPLLYWARLSRGRPKACAIRFGIAMFLYLQVLVLALGFDTIRLGILSQATALNVYAPFMVPFCLLASVLLYVVARQMLKGGPQSG
jgi:hypothetical protein